MSGRSKNYFLTKLDPTEGVHDDRDAFATTDRDAIDHLLHIGAETHRHSGQTVNPVAEPSVGVNLSLIPDGAMPAGTRIYYVTTFISDTGLESAPGPESYIDIPAPLPPPVAPSAILDTSTGALTPGDYYYALTAVEGSVVTGPMTVDPTRETELSEAAYVRVAAGIAQARITVVFPDAMPPGAAAYNLYRRQPGDQLYQFMATILDAETPFVDDGSLLPTIDRNPPPINQTNANLGVIVELGETLPGGYTWRLYRTTVSGHYEASLVAEMTETITAEAAVVLTSVIDDGAPPFPGTPPERTLLVSNPAKILLTDGAEVEGRLPSHMVEQLPIVITLGWTEAQIEAVPPAEQGHWIEYDEVALLGGRLRAEFTDGTHGMVTVDVVRVGEVGETFMFQAVLPTNGFYSTAVAAVTDAVFQEGDRVEARIVGPAVTDAPTRMDLVLWFELRSYLPVGLRQPDQESIWADATYRGMETHTSLVYSDADDLKTILEAAAAPNVIIGLQPGTYSLGGAIDVDLADSHPNQIGFGRFGGSCLVMPCDQWGAIREDFRGQVVVHSTPDLDPAGFVDLQMTLGHVAFAGINFTGRTKLSGHHVVLYDCDITYPVDLWGWLAAKKIGIDDETGWVDETLGNPADPTAGMGQPTPLIISALSHSQLWGIDVVGGDGVLFDGSISDVEILSLSVTIQTDGATDLELLLDAEPVSGANPPETFVRAEVDPFTDLALRGVEVLRGPVSGLTVAHVGMNGSWRIADWNGTAGGAVVDVAFLNAWVHHTASYALEHIAIAPVATPAGYGIGGRLADLAIWQNAGASWRQDRWGDGAVASSDNTEPYSTPPDVSGRVRVLVAPAASTTTDPASTVRLGVPRLISTELGALDVQANLRQPANAWRATAPDLFELTGWSRT